MKHINRLSEFGGINAPERTRGIPDAYFLCTLAYGSHGFPIVRLITALHPIELITRFAPCRRRKGPQVIERTASELDRLGAVHNCTIQDFIYSSKRGISLRYFTNFAGIRGLSASPALLAQRSLRGLMEPRHGQRLELDVAQRAQLGDGGEVAVVMDKRHLVAERNFGDAAVDDAADGEAPPA